MKVVPCFKLPLFVLFVENISAGDVARFTATLIVTPVFVLSLKPTQYYLLSVTTSESLTSSPLLHSGSSITPFLLATEIKVHKVTEFVQHTWTPPLLCWCLSHWLRHRLRRSSSGKVQQIHRRLLLHRHRLLWTRCCGCGCCCCCILC